MKEAEVAVQVRDWLVAQGWEVYCEVVAAGGRCDIVALSGPLVWIVEVKNVLSLALLAQAHERLRYANFVSVATPVKKRKRSSNGRLFAERVCMDYGIGSIQVSGPLQEGWDPHVKETTRPRFNRRPVSIRKDLYAAQKESTPGAVGGGYVTPFSEMVEELRRRVRDNPGCSLKEAVDAIRHHYSSATTARACISRYIRNGVIKGLRVEGRPLRIFVEGATSDVPHGTSP